MRCSTQNTAGLCLAAVIGCAAPAGARAQSVEALQPLSIDQLANIDVSSVTKTDEAVRDAPAAIYVITHDDIVRSGATSLPEILRLAPNLEVFQSSASQYVITARGFNGANADQSFSNKLLVLIDGRSVYTPLYSGVYWDMQDVLPQDIDRIEVISGPGATLWGANAVNGVINIITRKASETQGGLVDIQTGNLETSLGLRYGGKVGDDLAWRAYVRDVIDYDTPTATGGHAHDGWSKPQGGFRLDWAPTAADAVTVQGDGYAGTQAQQGAPNSDIQGGDVLARWSHGFDDGSNLQVLTYFDESGRATADDNGHFTVDAYDLEAQHSFALGGWNQIVWGAGLRISHYDIRGTPTLYFVPARGDLDLFDAFAQDNVSLGHAVKLIVGLKLEDDPYSGLAALPNARISWTPSDAVMLWAAASRAIRSPTPFDRNVREVLAGQLYLIGDADFKPEALAAYEAGARLQPTGRLSFSISAYYNRYDDLRSIELAPVTVIPLRWGNMIRGADYGLEAWGDFNATSWWRLSAGFDALHEAFTFSPQASATFIGIGQLGDDPRYQAQVKSSMTLGHDVTLDGDLRYVDALPAPSVPAYVELNARLGWKLSRHVQLSVSGFNLLHDRHQELPAPALRVPRSVLAGLQWDF